MLIYIEGKNFAHKPKNMKGMKMNQKERIKTIKEIDAIRIGLKQHDKTEKVINYLSRAIWEILAISEDKEKI